MTAFFILILFLTFTFVLGIKTSKPSAFKILLNKDDPFRNSHNFVTVLLDSQFRDYGQVAQASTSIVPLSLAMGVCASSAILTNLLIFTSTDEELKGTLTTISQQITQLRQKTNPGSRFYCRIFVATTTCSKTQLRPYHFGSGHNVSIPFNWESDLFLVQYCANSTKGVIGVKIWEVYTVKSHIFANFLTQQKVNSKYVIVPLNLTEFSLAHLSNPKVRRRHNLRGINLTVAAFTNKEDEDDNPFEIKLGKGKNGEDTFVSGFSVSILNDFRKAMNFTQNVLKIHFNQANYFEKSFLSNETHFDINIYHTGVTKNRTRVAQPLHPTFFDGIHAIFVQPMDRTVRNIYRKPFAFALWSVLFYTWACIFLSCKLTTYLHARLDSTFPKTTLIKAVDREQTYVIPVISINPSDDDKYNSKFETLLWCIGAICQQGWHTTPTTTSARLIIATGLLLSFVCYAAYTGKIVSELYDVPKSIKNLNQLLSYSEEVYLLSSGDTSDDILEGLERTSPAVLKKIKFKTVDKIYRKLLQRPGKTCAITWPDNLYSFVQENEEGGAKTGVDAYLCETFFSFSFQATSSLFLPKYSELEQLFNYRIIVGLERGFIRRYWKTYMRHTKLFCLRNNPKVTTLDFGHVFFAFLILWSGMVLCVVLLIVENVVSRASGKDPHLIISQNEYIQ